MQITTTVDIDISAKAVYRDGKVAVSLSASSPYDGNKRQVSVNLDVSEEAFEALFAELIESNQDILLQKLEAGRSEAITVAARMGEL